MAIAETLKEIHDNVPEVYKAGRSKGYSEGYSAGTQNGLPSQWDYFWDGFQMGTTSTEGVKTTKRTDYNFAFSYGWTVDTFKPKYDIIPTGVCMKTFLSSKISGDLVEILSQCNVKLNTSGCTNLTQFLSVTLFTRVGEIDLTGVNVASGCYGIFASWEPSYLKTIDKLIVNEKNVFNYTFGGCTALKNLTIDGTIGQNGFNVQWSTLLSKESILGTEATEEELEAGTNLVFLNDKYYYGGIFGALSDKASGLTVTLSKTAVNNAFEISKGAADGSTSEEWAALIATKQNWAISLV